MQNPLFRLLFYDKMLPFSFDDAPAMTGKERKTSKKNRGEKKLNYFLITAKFTRQPFAANSVLH